MHDAPFHVLEDVCDFRETRFSDFMKSSVCCQQYFRFVWTNESIPFLNKGYVALFLQSPWLQIYPTQCFTVIFYFFLKLFSTRFFIHYVTLCVCMCMCLRVNVGDGRSGLGIHVFHSATPNSKPNSVQYRCVQNVSRVKCYQYFLFFFFTSLYFL